MVAVGNAAGVPVSVGIAAGVRYRPGGRRRRARRIKRSLSLRSSRSAQLIWGTASRWLDRVRRCEPAERWRATAAFHAVCDPGDAMALWLGH